MLKERGAIMIELEENKQKLMTLKEKIKLIGDSL